MMSKSLGPESLTDKDYEFDELVQGVKDYSTTGSVRALLRRLSKYLVIPNKDGDIPLGLAIIQRRKHAAINIIESTLAAGLNCLQQKNSLGQTVLHLCLLNDSYDILEYLFTHRVKQNILSLLDLPLAEEDLNGDTFLHLALEKRNIKTLKWLKVHVDALRGHNSTYNDSWLNKVNGIGQSALHIAVDIGDNQSIQLLFDLGCNANVQDSEGETPLHAAVKNDSLGCVASLLSHVNINMDILCSHDQTPLHYACWGDNLAMVALLMTRDPDVRCRAPSLDNDQSSEKIFSSPADIASARSNYQMLRLLEGENLMPTLVTKSDLQSREYSEVKTDMSRVDYKLRSRIASLMKLDDDMECWKDLACRLKLEKLIPFLQNVKDPVLILLDNYELLDGSVEELYDVVVAMERLDVAHLLVPLIDKI